MPPVDKKVVYLDQFAISEIFKIKSKTRRERATRQDFWEAVERETNHAYLLQQVIFPASNIHHDETIVSPFSNELSLAHEMLSGDTAFLPNDEIEMLQIREFAKAYFANQQPPNLSFNVDEILRGKRNEWIPDIHISANMDFSMFAERTRAHRDATAAEFLPLMEGWKRDKPAFRDVLKTELTSFGSANRSALRFAVERAARAMGSSDVIEFFDGLSHPTMDQFKELKSYFEDSGIDPANSAAEVGKYWDWPGNEFLPSHRISAYLFAALSRRIASGQKFPTQGIFNDFRAIHTYAPYVDAMFLDRECAQILSERPLCTDLTFKAKIFSVKSEDAFLDYLRDLQSRASDKVRAYAAEIYGIE